MHMLLLISSRYDSDSEFAGLSEHFCSRAWNIAISVIWIALKLGPLKGKYNTCRVAIV